VVGPRTLRMRSPPKRCDPCSSTAMRGSHEPGGSPNFRRADGQRQSGQDNESPGSPGGRKAGGHSSAPCRPEASSVSIGTGTWYKDQQRDFASPDSGDRGGRVYGQAGSKGGPRHWQLAHGIRAGRLPARKERWQPRPPPRFAAPHASRPTFQSGGAEFRVTKQAQFAVFRRSRHPPVPVHDLSPATLAGVNHNSPQIHSPPNKPAPPAAFLFLLGRQASRPRCGPPQKGWRRHECRNWSRPRGLQRQALGAKAAVGGN